MQSPFRFIKAHPWGFVLSAATGMVAGPWAVGVIRRNTGISIQLPRVGGRG